MHVFRPEPTPIQEPAIYLEAAGMGSESWQGIEIVLAGHEPRERLLFGGAETDWEEWNDGIFGPRLVPWIIRAREVAGLGLKEWGEVDQGFGAGIGSVREITRSLRAGRSLACLHAGARHFQPLDRLRRKLDGEPGAGHAAMVVAFLGAQFNVPTTACVVTCLFLEWRSAFPRKDRGQFERMTPRLGALLPTWFRDAGFPALQSLSPE